MKHNLGHGDQLNEGEYDVPYLHLQLTFVLKGQNEQYNDRSGKRYEDEYNAYAVDDAASFLFRSIFTGIAGKEDPEPDT